MPSSTQYIKWAVLILIFILLIIFARWINMGIAIGSYHNAYFGYSNSIEQSKEKTYFLQSYTVEPIQAIHGQIKIEEMWLEEIEGHRILHIKISNNEQFQKQISKLKFDLEGSNDVFMGTELPAAILISIMSKDLFKANATITNNLNDKKINIELP